MLALSRRWRTASDPDGPENAPDETGPTMPDRSLLAAADTDAATSPPGGRGLVGRRRARGAWEIRISPVMSSRFMPERWLSFQNFRIERKIS
jgi:hypothetical protein